MNDELSGRIEGYVENAGLSDPMSLTQSIDKEEVRIWLELAQQAEKESAKTEILIDLLNLEDMEGDFNMCMGMQRKAHDGNRDDTTRKFWLDKTRHKRSLIEAYESLMKESQ